MRKAICAMVLLFCISLGFSQQKIILVNCVNRIYTTETKYQNGKVIEVIEKDLGYSSINQQLINFVIIKLQDLNFRVITDTTKPYDYEIIIDSLCTELGSWNSTYIRLNDISKSKKYSRFLKNARFTSETLTEDMSTRICTFITDNLKNDLTSILFFNAINNNGYYINAINNVNIRANSMKAAKTKATLPINEEFQIMEIDTSPEREDDVDYFQIKIKTKSGIEGWGSSNMVSISK